MELLLCLIFVVLVAILYYLYKEAGRRMLIDKAVFKEITAFKNFRVYLDKICFEERMMDLYRNEEAIDRITKVVLQNENTIRSYSLSLKEKQHDKSKVKKLNKRG